MKKEVSPALMVVALAIVVVVVAVFGYKMLGSKGAGSADKTKSGADLQRVMGGGKLYSPPAGAPVPGAGGSMMGGPTGGPPISRGINPPSGPAGGQP